MGRNLAAIAVFSFFCITSGRAQTFAEVTGAVTDPSGAVVAGATITITNTATNQVRQVESNESGNYTVPFLVPGLYDLTAEQEGFKLASRTAVELQVGDFARVDFDMEVGVVTEVVEVFGGAPLLDTESTAVGTVIENKRIIELPLNGRNYLQMIALSTNVTAEQGAGAKPRHAKAASGPSKLFPLPDSEWSSIISRWTVSRTPTSAITCLRCVLRSTLCKSSKCRPGSTRRSTGVPLHRSTSQPSPGRTSFTARCSSFIATRTSIRVNGGTKETRTRSCATSSGLCSAGRWSETACSSCRTSRRCAIARRSSEPPTWQRIECARAIFPPRGGRFTTT